MTVVGRSSIVSNADFLEEKIRGWRRDIHSNPELSFHEYETSDYIAKVLEPIQGISIQRNIAGTGIVATLGTGESPIVALRADMDALPIIEKNSHSFVSRTEGVMHACGHDAHTSILLGAAQILSEYFMKERPTGTIRFLFQPAEESADESGMTGAPYMIQAGVLNGVQAAVALHMNPESPVGEIWVNDGYSMANVDNFRGVILGKGGHAAYPHLTVDPIWMLASVLQALHGIVSRRISPLKSAVVSIGQIHSGTTSNVIPTEVIVEGTLRSYDPQVREALIEEVERAFSVARVLGGDYRFELVRGEPALYNDPQVNQVITDAISTLYPNSKITRVPFGLGGEDFGHMTQKISGAMFFLGCQLPDGIVRGLHTPEFDIDERILPMGAAILAETARRLLTAVL